MEEEERADLLKILSEVRKMNDMERQNRKSILQMRDTVDYYQELFESISKDIRSNDIIREIRIELLRLSILVNPATRELFRTQKKPLSTYHERPLADLGLRHQTANTPQQIIESSLKHRPESGYLASTGFVLLNEGGIVYVEFLNPEGATKTVQSLIISGGGTGLAALELLLDGNPLVTEKAMTVINSDVALNANGTAVLRTLTTNTKPIGGEVIYSMILSKNITISNEAHRLVLAPGHRLTVSLTNLTARRNRVGLNLSWREVPHS